MFEQIKALLVEELDVPGDIITLEAEFVNDLKLNSLEIADLVVMCEENFKVVIEEEDMHKLITLGDLIDYLEERK